MNNWLHGMADAGLKAIRDELKEHNLTTVEDMADFVKKLIGDTGTIHRKDHPFMWKPQRVAKGGSRTADSDSFDPITRRIKRQVHHSLRDVDITNMKRRIWDQIIDDATIYCRAARSTDDEVMEADLDVKVDESLYDPGQQLSDEN
ncbi:hypothetical protein BDQ17DRAFT_1333106 [Cyathus striatus]|nr:hypothetical protein BDQ17DRAFT_1333106 [Cyathus striatus]